MTRFAIDALAALRLVGDDLQVAEFIAVARLQADALVTLDPELARRIEGVVAVEPFEALLVP